MEQVQYLPETPLALVPPRRSRGTLLLVIGAIAGFCAVGSLLILLATAATKSAGSAQGPGNQQTTPAPATTPAPPPQPGIGDVARDGQFEFVVREVKCGQKRVGRGFLKRDAQGQFCIVSFTLRNVGHEQQAFSEAVQQAVDRAGGTHQADSAAGALVNERLDQLWRTVGPGDEIDAKIVFDIPKKAELAALELHESPFSEGITIAV